ncbi:mediator of RNA polymerase II transcription subunit 17-like [Hibiscus syriacus]|uniref:mediator of RNA polymerase II transcription subunit 17-like n=1 Tax=Hibiscus syriacus TaxID=106335 RepID=UPI00192180BA|nr:mediator of RNA polymerase II transcription subunit 17-like [Hibiscus syriacus]
MDGNLEISFAKLPVNRLDAIEDPPDSSYDEKRASLIRRIDLSWAVKDDEERGRKKKKKNSKVASYTWQWQSMVENFQELCVIIDLINAVSSPAFDCILWLLFIAAFATELLSFSSPK